MTPEVDPGDKAITPLRFDIEVDSATVGADLLGKRGISTWGISNLHVEKENSPRRGEMKLRKKQMKLRKKEITSPKNFSFPHWIIRDPYLGISEFLHRVVGELLYIMCHSCPLISIL